MSDEKWETEVMRANEVRKMLRIGRNTLYNWVEEGRIPYKKVGRVLLFSRKAIIIWLESRNEEGINERTNRN
jgi:excisionase family DNA binding protein